MKRLTPVLKQDGADIELIMLIRTILAAGKEIAFRLSQGELAGVLGSTLDENIQGEVQKKLDVLSNQLIKDMLLDDDSVKTIASEEEDDVVGANKDGRFIVAFDPLDGSSNIDINGQVGTIFTIYNALPDVSFDSKEQFNQKGEQQVCAGYLLYGASTLLVMTTGGPTRCYTLDLTHGGFLLTEDELAIPVHRKEFSVNIANYRYWNNVIQKHFDDVLYSSEEYAGYTMRWNAAMVGDVHRVITRGGLYLYPADNRKGHANGKIRLLYEANPLAMLTENAGGLAHANGERILTMQPTDIHQRVPVTIGSRHNVEAYDAACC